MAIVVQCYNCRSRLELDDGFRGGVCRCSKCGSLLKVPIAAGPTDPARTRPADPGARLGSNRPRDPNEDPGLSASGLRDRSPQRPAMPPPTSSGALAGFAARPIQPVSTSRSEVTLKSVAPQSPLMTRSNPPVRPIAQKPSARLKSLAGKNKVLALTLASLIILFILATIVIFIVTFSHHHNNSTLSQESRLDTGSAIGVGFLGIPLTGEKIVFSLDGSSANLDSFNLVAACVKNSITKMNIHQRVKFAIWTPNGLKLFPRHGWLDMKHAATATRAVLNYSPYGSTDAAKALQATLKLGGDQVIVVTAKVFLSDSHIVTDVAKWRRDEQIIDVVSVNGERKELKQIAHQSGGTFRFLTVSDLQNALGQ
ncbi:MAG: hypothetical protein M0Z50_01560 [Planctomycetia bacterium]|nr:hypothetical protein [Planctomycetia bacterium]